MSSTDGALNLGGWTVSAAAAGGTQSASTQRNDATATRNTARYSSRKPSTDRGFELRGGLEARCPPGHRDSVTRSGIAQRARPPARDREGSEADQRDRLAPSQGAAHGREHRAEGAL